MPQAVPDQARQPEVATSWSQPVASRSVAVVMTPPLGPTISRSLGSLSTVSRARVGRSGSMIGHRAAPPALGLLGDQTAAPGVGLAAHVEQAAAEVDVADRRGPRPR